jgi:hypothetical protein
MERAERGSVEGSEVIHVLGFKDGQWIVRWGFARGESDERLVVVGSLAGW